MTLANSLLIKIVSQLAQSHKIKRIVHIYSVLIYKIPEIILISSLKSTLEVAHPAQYFALNLCILRFIPMSYA